MNRLAFLIPLLFALAVPYHIAGQSFTNHWIDHSQRYYKIKVAEDGIYRIDYQTLQDYGFPVNSINPLNIQVFGRGVEQPIYVKNEQTGSLSPGDYIEFYGRANDGWLDKQLFIDSSGHMNKGYSLFCDTASYFLTWNNATNNRRLTLSHNTNYNAYPAEDYFMHTVRDEYTNRYYAGEPSSWGVTDPEYRAAEGWFGHAISRGGSRSYNVATPNRYTSGPQSNVRFSVIGASDYKDAAGNSVSPNHHLRVEFANEVVDTTYTGYVITRFQRMLATASLSANNTFVFRSINDLGVGADRNAVAFIEITYPHTTNLNGQGHQYFSSTDTTSGFRRYDFSGFSASSNASVFIYDLTNGRRISVDRSGANVQVLIPNGGGEKKCLLTSSDQIIPVTELHGVSNGAQPHQFTDYSNQSAQFIIVSHRKLIEDPAQSIQEYADYRTNNGLPALVVDVEDLYNQFAYGIYNHPLGIRKFVEYAWGNFSPRPQYLFLAGKGYRAANTNTRRGNLYHQNLVPSLGNAPSDILFSSGILDNLYKPALATGRISARNAGHIQLYLNKLKEYDAARSSPEMWQKRLLHFAGGSNASEQAQIQGFLNSYAQIARDTFLGGHVHTFYKTTTDPIQINKVDEIRKYINEGALMLTFFGHAAGIGFDISIDDPVTYDNQGKYPFLLANSCFAGDLFLESASSAEEWVLVENKGVIGYLASISPAVASSLHVYSTWFHRNMSTSQYGESLGKVIQQTIGDIQMDNFNRKEISLAMTLHGDPAVSLYHQAFPDYKVSPEDITFNPATITTEVDSFSVHMAIQNLGKAIRDTFFLEITRTFPDQTTQTRLLRVPAPLFADTFSVRFPVEHSQGVGMNRMEIFVDAYNEVHELTTNNNRASTQFYIRSANIIPVYPHDFAIVPGPEVTLKASTSDPLAPSRKYIFQIDTAHTFNSPALQTKELTTGGGVARWTPPIAWQDSTVYYWRTSLDSTYTGEYSWLTHSFQYIQGKEGWAQAHFPQFLGNSFRFMEPSEPSRQFNFINITNQINVKTGVWPNTPWNNKIFRINNDILRLWTCLNQYPDYIGVLIAVFDTLSGWPVNSKVDEIQSNGLGKFNNVHCLSYDYPVFEYFTNSTMGYGNLYEAPQSWWFDQIVNFMDSIPDGTPVLIYSVQNHNAETYTEEMYQAFESIGSALIRSINNDQPYIIYGTKGDVPGMANEVAGLGPDDEIILQDSIRTRWTEGHMMSPVIGPAAKWGSLHWDFQYSQPAGRDSVALNVLGYKTDGSVDTVISGISPDSLDIYGLDHRFSALEYPRIQLMLTSQDDSLNTPVQLTKWQVLYAGVPETAINATEHFAFHNDTIMQGDTLRFSIATENISSHNMDSLKVRYWIMDQSRVEKASLQKMLRPHPAGDVLVDSVKFPTNNLSGQNQLWVEFNPGNHQPEITRVNNLAEIPFLVSDDKTNPLLDVTFDGVRIMDGDIVSAEPYVIIRLQDENPYLPLKDTSNINVFLKYPSASDFKRVYFQKDGMMQMEFTPASLPENISTIEYEARFMEDGVYTLLIQAQDESGNKAGKNDYTVNFEVINKPSITHMLNWPNPFSDHTHFVFTLTGSRVPDYLKIQIMTVTGKVVREIEQHELGPLRIGNNVTEYAWDGTDQFGDRLANGVYLYRVITRMDGQEMEHRETKADHFFHEGFGKMYLIR